MSYPSSRTRCGVRCRLADPGSWRRWIPCLQRITLSLHCARAMTDKGYTNVGQSRRHPLSRRGRSVHPRAQRAIEPDDLAAWQSARHDRHGDRHGDDAARCRRARSRQLGLHHRRRDHRRWHRLHYRAQDTDDGDAATRRGVSFARRSCRRAGCRGGLSIRPDAFGIVQSPIPGGIEAADADRDVDRRCDRRGDVHRLGDRVLEAQRQYERQADPFAGAPCRQRVARRRADRADRHVLLSG